MLFILIYGFLFTICFIFNKTINIQIYLYTLKNIDYFLWHGYVIKNNILFKYFVYYLLSSILFIFLFPIISFFIPKWHKVFKTDGVIHSVPISLNNNKILSKHMQSKIFWYNCLKNNNINTPKIYYYKTNNKFIKLNNINQLDDYILKPIYGTQGQNIKKINHIEINEINIENNFLLQEFIKDCYVNNSRHFRINTIYDSL
jgi:hypothetical protein